MKRLVVGILAHVDAGKTTLSEGILYTCGAIRKMGRVDHKDAFLDTNALERSRGITIFSKQAVFLQMYAPRPFFLPVVSIQISPSGDLTILTSSFLDLDSLQPIHFLIGIFFCCTERPPLQIVC